MRRIAWRTIRRISRRAGRRLHRQVVAAGFVLLVVLSACTPQSLPTVEISPSPVDTLLPFVPTEPAAVTPSASSARLFDIMIDNVAAGLPGQAYASGFGGAAGDLRQFARWDGTSWIALGSGFPTAGNGLTSDSIGQLYTEILTQSEQGMATAIMRWDGGKWQDITGNFNLLADRLQAGRISSNIPVVALAVDAEDDLYAAGMFYYPTTDHTGELPVSFVARWDRENWSILGQGLNELIITDLAVSAAGEVYVSGEQPVAPGGNSGFIAKWDGETWSQFDTGKLNYTQRIALDQSGRLFAYDPSNVIAYWDGGDWIIIADQLGGEAPAVYDMKVAEDGQLYIGGSFESVSGVPARYIACWDGKSWYALGEGVNERVNALAFAQNGDLYAVGFFTQAGNLPADHAALWDGTAWHSLGP